MNNNQTLTPTGDRSWRSKRRSRFCQDYCFPTACRHIGVSASCPVKRSLRELVAAESKATVNDVNRDSTWLDKFKSLGVIQ